MPARGTRQQEREAGEADDTGENSDCADDDADTDAQHQAELEKLAAEGDNECAQEAARLCEVQRQHTNLHILKVWRRKLYRNVKAYLPAWLLTAAKAHAALCCTVRR